MSKPSLTPAIADAIVAAVARGVPVTTATRAAGITDTTLKEWLSLSRHGRYADGSKASDLALSLASGLVERIEAAQAEYEQQQLDMINAATGVVGKSGVPEWRSATWILNNHPTYRQKYRQYREVLLDQTVTVTHEQTLTQELPPSDLANMYQALGDGGVVDD